MTKNFLIVLAACGTLLIRPAIAEPNKPNVLFLIADDLNTALSGFGHKQCKTPNLDRLAERGVKFQNMHCQYPVCGSSRASIMSGLYPYSNLTLGNEGTLRGSMPDVVTLSQTFRNNGYYAARVSKIYHMPFIISVPWLKDQHGRRADKITELVDLYPTLAELAGIPAPDTLQGTSLKPLLTDTDSPAWTKNQAFTISRSGGESLRTKDWRFTQWGFGDKGLELYDLRTDPGEFTNQANNPEYTSELRSLQKQLLAKRAEAGFTQNREAIVGRFKKKQKK